MLRFDDARFRRHASLSDAPDERGQRQFRFLGRFVVGVGWHDLMRDQIARGKLVPVLEKFCEPFPGYYLFYPPAGTPRRRYER